MRTPTDAYSNIARAHRHLKGNPKMSCEAPAWTSKLSTFKNEGCGASGCRRTQAVFGLPLLLPAKPLVSVQASQRPSPEHAQAHPPSGTPICPPPTTRRVPSTFRPSPGRASGQPVAQPVAGHPGQQPSSEAEPEPPCSQAGPSAPAIAPCGPTAHQHQPGSPTAPQQQPQHLCHSRRHRRRRRGVWRGGGPGAVPDAAQQGAEAARRRGACLGVRGAPSRDAPGRLAGRGRGVGRGARRRSLPRPRAGPPEHVPRDGPLLSGQRLLCW
jgi:hypothetical protein